MMTDRRHHSAEIFLTANICDCQRYRMFILSMANHGFEYVDILGEVLFVHVQLPTVQFMYDATL